MVHVARTGKTAGRRQAQDALGTGCRGLLREHEAADDRAPPALLGLLGEADRYVNAGLTERYRLHPTASFLQRFRLLQAMLSGKICI